MSYAEAMQPCALFPDTTSAERAVAVLAEHGIEAAIVAPAERTHGLARGTLQIVVPGTQAARARALLNASAANG